MEQTIEQMTFLMADDDPDDRLLTERALKECHQSVTVKFVQDGEELLDYLLHRGDYSNPETSPRPRVILLDLNMPRMDGWQALAAIRGHSALRKIPVIIMTTSHADDDIEQSYECGANAFITKPVSYQELVIAMQSLAVFWFKIVQLPMSIEAHEY